MTLLLITLFGLLALVGVICALEVAWSRSDPRAALGTMIPDGASAEDVERELVADLLAGTITGAHYRAALGSLAAAEPQPAALQRLVRRLSRAQA